MFWVKNRNGKCMNVGFTRFSKTPIKNHNTVVYHTTTSVKSGKPQQANNKLISNIPTPDQAYVPNLNRISKSILDIYLFISVCYNKNYISIL